jgi:large subunit ribosomal protein L10
VDRSQKRELIDRLHATFAKAESVVVTRYSGLNVAELTELRRQMRQMGAGFKVVKNRLTKRALDGTAYGPLADLLQGPTAIAYSGDPVAAAKAVTDFAKKNEKLVLVGGAIGQNRLDAAAVRALAQLPSLDQLRGKLVGLLQAPAAKLAALTKAPAGQLARLFAAFAAEAKPS